VKTVTIGLQLDLVTPHFDDDSDFRFQKEMCKRYKSRLRKLHVNPIFILNYLWIELLFYFFLQIYLINNMYNLFFFCLNFKWIWLCYKRITCLLFICCYLNIKWIRSCIFIIYALNKCIPVWVYIYIYIRESWMKFV